MPNPNGDAGNSITVVLGDKVTVVGDNPNTNPAVYTNPTGRDTDTYSFIDDSGMMQAKTALPTFTPIDNASDFHGGNYTITAMNAIHFEAGGGGLSADINGSIALSSWGGIVNITSTNQVSAQAEVVQLACTNAVLLTGPTFYVDTDETIFNKNVKFGCNVAVNGGLAVAGELFATHLSTVRSVASTGESPVQYGYPIGTASFTAMLTPDPLLPPGILSPIEQALLPAIPYRITIIPDPVAAAAPTPIIAIPPHEHLYNTIATTTYDTHSELNDAMRKVESNEPVDAEPNLIQGMKPSELMKKIEKKVQKRITAFIKACLGF